MNIFNSNTCNRCKRKCEQKGNFKLTNIVNFYFCEKCYRIKQTNLPMTVNELS